MKKICLLVLISLLAILVGCNQQDETNVVKPNEEEPTLPNDSNDSNLLAHWKFQNIEGCYTGNIENDDLTFIDLSGNGNDMVVASEGLGKKLDVFSWDIGVSGEGSTSLKMNNTLALAESVDPYDKSDNTYSGAYVSGKYLETVDSAPLNMIDEEFWTIEVVFKISTDWNNSYNRYTGIFSRQHVSEIHDEPYFSMAMAAVESDDTIEGAIGEDTLIGLQFLHIDENSKSNREFSEIKANQWIYYMVVGNYEGIKIYVNGQLVESISNKNCKFNMSYNAIGWEVGVGRKYGEGANTMNIRHPEGLIRRLFCGSISEIRFSSKNLTIEESLFYQSR